MNKQLQELLKGAMHDEYIRSLDIYPKANIPHGSLGVIAEEVAEADDEMTNIKDKIIELQEEVYKAKGYPHQISKKEIELLDGIMLDAMHAIGELIQVSAMCIKYKESYDQTKL